MIRKQILPENIKPRQRNAYNDVVQFINSNQCYEGRILILYGLRRTGKTTIMEQVMYALEEPYAYYEMNDGDCMRILTGALIEESKSDIKYVFIDELTRVCDLDEQASVLSDVFAKRGMRIVVAGTDSLGFLNAERTELYDRTTHVNTTYIPFAEHNRVLNTDSLDDFIEYGGLMRKGEHESRIVNDYNSVCKYLDSAVSSNITNSIQRSIQDSSLSELSSKEILCIVEKMVEIYSGQWNEKQVNDKLKSVSVNGALAMSETQLNDLDVSIDIRNEVIKKRSVITEDFAKRINADVTIEHHLTKVMIEELQKMLFDMNLLSTVPRVEFEKTDADEWESQKSINDAYVIQPAIKYYHLKQGLDFIENEVHYKRFNERAKQIIKSKLDQKIKGDMTEQIVLFDTRRSLSPEKYLAVKPQFKINGVVQGEYDMLIYNKESNEYYAYEIKHTSNPYPEQTKHLINPEFRSAMDYFYGERVCACVLYNGKSFKAEEGIHYLNITDFLTSIFETRDIQTTMDMLISHSANAHITKTSCTFNNSQIS